MFFNSYLLSKLLPQLLSPLGIILILLLVFFIKKKIKYIYSAFAFLIIFSNGILANSLWKFLEQPWKRIDYSLVSSADGIVVLSYGRVLPPGNSKIIEWRDPDRFLAGIELYKANKAKRLIFTGNKHPSNNNILPPEGDIYIQEAILRGIPKKDLYTTYEVFNTFQEAKAVKSLLNEKVTSKYKNIILVTSAYHMNRAKRVFEREGINVIPYPVDFRSRGGLRDSLKNPLQWVPNAHALRSNSIAVREIIGRFVYRAWK